MNKKGFKLIRIWVNKNDVSIEFQGYKGRMRFSLSGGSDLYKFLQNINFDHVELYHHKVLKAEADFTSGCGESTDWVHGGESVGWRQCDSVLLRDTRAAYRNHDQYRCSSGVGRLLGGQQHV